ncbi:MAG TPA: hypothetical protein DEB06_02215 [Phycisphaerales bacterium]|nr:hypothetical protein [Phycisphaerales bacterium]
MMMMATLAKPVRVLCVDDHAMLLEGLRARFDREPDIELAGTLTTVDGLASEVERSGATVVLLDIDMPGEDVFDALDDLHRRHPETRAIMLTAHIRDTYIDSAIAAGAWGYLSKSDAPDTIVEGVRKVAAGELAFSPDVEERVNAARHGRAVKPGSKLTLLTPREQQILRMIGMGQGRQEIAHAIHRSPKTVDAHRASIMEKLAIHDRVELARYAIREGLVEV